jgi:hypothetical protein
MLTISTSFCPAVAEVGIGTLMFTLAVPFAGTEILACSALGPGVQPLMEVTEATVKTASASVLLVKDI